MNEKVMYADEKSILVFGQIMYWMLLGVDESIVVFDSDGTGFIHYTQIDFDIIETSTGRWIARIHL